MDMMSVMWQFGVLAAVIIFGIKIGLASGLANLSKKFLHVSVSVMAVVFYYVHMLHHSLLNRLLKLFIVIILFFI